MRRKDLEITDFHEITDIISRCPVLRIGISTDDVPYVVPVSFGYEIKDSQVIFYFHGAQAGAKYSLIKNNPNLFLEGDIFSGYTQRPNGGISCLYESFMATGTAERIYGDEAARALDLLTEHCGFSPRPCPDGVLDITAVYRVTAKSLTGKRSE